MATSVIITADVPENTIVSVVIWDALSCNMIEDITLEDGDFLQRILTTDQEMIIQEMRK